MACTSLRFLSSRSSKIFFKKSYLSCFELKAIGLRNFLSEAYRCQEAWSKRLEAPIIKKINLDEMYYELDQKFQQEGNISAVDVDIFSAAVSGEVCLDELEDLVHRLRLSASAAQMLPSTPHNLIRSFLEADNTDALLRVLHDRLNYGVFPDHYCANLMMDTYLKRKQYLEAAKVGVLQMLQEDWEHPLTTRLSLLSCLQYLNSPTPWESVGQSPQPPPESDEEIKVRVKYLRNPFFDDHFDLIDGRLLVGKTLAILSPHLPPSPMSRSLELLGWTLYGKWDKAEQQAQKWKQEVDKNTPILLMQGVEMMKEAMKTEESSKEEEENTDGRAKVLSILEGLSVGDGRLLEPLEDLVREAATAHEQSDIELQKKTYVDWEKAREQELLCQLAEIEKEARLQKIAEKKQYLLEKEERLNFFDNEDQIDLLIEEKKPRYRKRWFGKLKKKRVLDENYIPPEVGRGHQKQN